METLVRAANLKGYHELVRELGEDPSVFLNRYHIPDNILKDDQGFLPHRTLLLLFETTAQVLDCPDFGMRLAKWQGLDMLGPIAVIARNAETVLTAFEAIAKYLYVHSPGLKLSLIDSHDEQAYEFKFEITHTNQLQLRQPYELSLANGARIIRLLGGEGAKAMSINFMHSKLASTNAYKKAYDCQINFEQPWCGFKISHSLAHRKIDTADADTRLLITQYLESQFSPDTTSLSVRISELIRKLLPTGHCNAENIAEHLAMHPRTLQRRLATEKCSYEKLLDTERQALAKHYLLESPLQLNQISGLLGYTEQSTFHRSCKRWFKLTPKKYRELKKQMKDNNI